VEDLSRTLFPCATIADPVFYRFSYDDVKEKPLHVLGKHALKLSGKANDDDRLKDYKITYLYTDEDGDNILVDSEAGLRTAFQEAHGKLKLMAIVKKIGELTAADSNALFIHGRHTCTGCSKNPILGKRFHNGKDMNLCETCHEEYTGDVKLKKVELDCDRLRQKQWRRQYRAEYREAVNTKKAQRQAARRLKKLVLSKSSEKEPKLDDSPVIVKKVVVGASSGGEKVGGATETDWQDIEKELPFSHVSDKFLVRNAM